MVDLVPLVFLVYQVSFTWKNVDRLNSSAYCSVEESKFLIAV